MNEKTLKNLSFIAMVLGFGGSILSSWTNKKEQERTIDNKVTEKVSEALKLLSGNQEKTEG